MEHEEGVLEDCVVPFDIYLLFLAGFAVLGLVKIGKHYDTFYTSIHHHQ